MKTFNEYLVKHKINKVLEYPLYYNECKDKNDVWVRIKGLDNIEKVLTEAENKDKATVIIKRFGKHNETPDIVIKPESYKYITWNFSNIDTSAGKTIRYKYAPLDEEYIKLEDITYEYWQKHGWK